MGLDSRLVVNLEIDLGKGEVGMSSSDLFVTVSVGPSA